VKRVKQIFLIAVNSLHRQTERAMLQGIIFNYVNGDLLNEPIIATMAQVFPV